MIGGDASPTAVLAVTLVFTAFATVATILRLVTRIRIAHNAGWDDWFISAAGALSLGSASLTILEALYDNRRMAHGLNDEEELVYARGVYASIILYNAALFCIKMSLLLQYLRIFPQTKFRYFCYTMIAVVFIYSSWCIWSAIFFCTPVAGFWDYTMPPSEKKCLNKQTVWYTNAAINIITDIAIVILPLPMVKQLNMPKRAKIALFGVFALGVFTCLVSILRLESLYAAAHLEGGLDFHGAMAALWSAVETNTGIICACLPTLRTLLARIVPNILTSSHRSDPSRHTGPLSSKRAQLSHHEYGRGLSGREEPSQRAYASRHSRTDDSLMLDDMDSSAKNIRVVTVVDQMVEGQRDHSTRSDQESTRDLIYRSSSSD